MKSVRALPSWVSTAVDPQWPAHGESRSARPRRPHPARRRTARARLSRGGSGERALMRCYGDGCRSPYAALVLNRAFAERDITIPVRQGGFGPDRRIVPCDLGPHRRWTRHHRSLGPGPGGLRKGLPANLEMRDGAGGLPAGERRQTSGRGADPDNYAFEIPTIQS